MNLRVSFHHVVSCIDSSICILIAAFIYAMRWKREKERLRKCIKQVSYRKIRDNLNRIPIDYKYTINNVGCDMIQWPIEQWMREYLCKSSLLICVIVQNAIIIHIICVNNIDHAWCKYTFFFFSLFSLYSSHMSWELCWHIIERVDVYLFIVCFADALSMWFAVKFQFFPFTMYSLSSDNAFVS